METSAIQKAVALSGGQTALARRLGVSQGLVWHWCAGRLKVAAERCSDIEAATEGQVTRAMLRADIFGDVPAPQLQEAG